MLIKMMIKLLQKTGSLFFMAFFLWLYFSVPGVFAEKSDIPGTWAYYKSHFISHDGRVMDIYQNQISHSEGQGYGLILSVHYNDRQAFENIAKWTLNNLMVRKDGLAAWSWGKRKNGQWGILDYNNATDGDILIAWGLLKGARLWKNKDWGVEAGGILKSVGNHLVILGHEKLILIPGYYGFTGKNILKINPGYFIFPAFKDFAGDDSLSLNPSFKNNGNSEKELNKNFWEKIYGDSLAMVKQALLTELVLPPDWFIMDDRGEIHCDPGNMEKCVFGFEAIRIPLYLAMAGDREGLGFFSTYLSFYDKLSYLPMSADLASKQISINEASAGFHAIMALCAGILGNNASADSLMKKARQKIKQEIDDYYSNTLYLLALSVHQP